jgi:hypothetical protein
VGQSSGKYNHGRICGPDPDIGKFITFGDIGDIFSIPGDSCVLQRIRFSGELLWKKKVDGSDCNGCGAWDDNHDKKQTSGDCRPFFQYNI